jgi:hypothetical protein
MNEKVLEWIMSYAWIFIAIFLIVFWTVVIYVAIHFIRKVW